MSTLKKVCNTRVKKYTEFQMKVYPVLFVRAVKAQIDDRSHLALEVPLLRVSTK